MKVSLLVKRRTDRSGAQPVYVRLSHLGAEARIALGVKLHPKHWNPRRQEVRASALDADGLNALLNERLATAQRVARDLVLEKGAKVSIAEVKKAVVAALHPEPDEASLPIVPWMKREVAEAYVARGKAATAAAYTSVIARLEDSLRAQGLRPDRLPAEGLTVAVLRKHRNRVERPKSQGGEGHKPNYVHKQITTIRALLRRAAKDGVPEAAEAARAAEGVEVRREKAERPAVPIDVVQAYAELDLTGRAADVRDWWRFAFYAGGARLSDVCRLRWSHIVRDADGRPAGYRMRQQKAGQPVALPLVPEAAEIVERWEARTGKSGEEPSPYVFGLQEEADESDPEQLRRAVSRRGALARKYLKKVCQAEGWPALGFHSARHSFARHMVRQGASLYAVSKALGHTKLSTTQAYLASFDDELVAQELRQAFGYADK